MDLLLKRGGDFLSRGDHSAAEKQFADALDKWRRASGPKDEEGKLVCRLGKALEAQRKLEQAYELYMNSLNGLTGQAYEEVMESLLYLNEKMGTFSTKPKNDDDIWRK